MMDREDEPYRVAPLQGRFAVKGISGTTILTCTDEASAGHYVVLLKDAYHAGFKAGFRAGKQAAGTR